VDSKYREIGTLVSGYAENGPFHCQDCIHASRVNSSCNHPVVVADPDLQGRLIQIDSGPAVTVSLEKGCCRFVKPPDVIALVMRHGDTVLNDEGRLRSRMDVDIDEQGQKQAQDATNYILKNYPQIQRIVTTPLKRTQETVAPIASAVGIQPEIMDEINTWHMGQLIGQKKDDVQGTLDYYIENEDAPIPGGESLSEVLNRSIPVLEKILEEAEDNPITLICMTSSVIVPLIKVINGEPMDEPGDDVGIGPGGLLAISIEGDGYSIKPVFGEPKPAEVGAS
jgi:broad specificity phosphatase PhoE